MGEKIRVVGNYKNILDIELNKATTAGGSRWIHIQNDKFRMCLSERDYLMVACSIIKAGRRLEEMKGNE